MSNSNREHPTCKYCGSSDVRADAWAEWNDEKQEWTLADTYENFWCEACESDCGSLKWVPSPQQSNEVEAA